jgi:hypothetical protein
MDMDDPEVFDFHWQMERDRCVECYTGSIQDALAAAKAKCVRKIGDFETGRLEWAYEGPDMPPFAVYMRWLGNRIDVARIQSKTAKSGLMEPLCDALEATDYDVRFECVHSPHLRAFLEARGYQAKLADYVLPLDLRQQHKPGP